jgi:hypothetical protein
MKKHVRLTRKARSAIKVMEVPMRGTNEAREMKRRASQRSATHKARLAALRLRTEKRMAAVEAARPKTKVGSKGSGKAAKASKSEKR